MAAYQHSETFAALKDIREELDGNLTTYQYLEVLDYFIEASIDPLASVVPGMLDSFYAAVTAWQSHKPSIKFSRDAKVDMPVKLFNALTTTGRTKRAFQRSMNLNRGLLFGLLTLFSRSVSSYRRLHNPTENFKRERRIVLMRKVENGLAVTGNLHSAILQFDWYSAKAYRFKELITQKYTRMALMSAKRTYTDLSFNVPLDDIVQIYLIFLNKAIDRCDSRQGVLTTFIQTWFYSARSEVQKGLADDQHTSYDDWVEKLPIKHIETSHPYEALQHLAHEAKVLDPQGVVRFSLNIPEFYSRRQLTLLSKFKQ